MEDLYAIYSLDIEEYGFMIVSVGSLEQCINLYNKSYATEKVICPYILGQTVVDLFKYKWYETEEPLIYKR